MQDASPVLVKSKSGHIAELYHGDSVKIVPAIGTVDTVLTDPPYIITSEGINRGAYFNAEPTEFTAAMEKKTNKIAEGYDEDAAWDSWIKAGAQNVLVFCSNQQIKSAIEQCIKHEMAYTVMAWCKTNAPPRVENTWMPDIEYMVHGRKKGAFMNNDVPVSLKRRYRVSARTSAEEHNGVGKMQHPCAKPVWLLRELLTVICPPGGRVLDPFMGSGATGVACSALGMNFVGIEREPTEENPDFEYFPLAVARISSAYSQLSMF